MKHTLNYLVTTLGMALLFLGVLAVVMFFFGRRHVKPLLPESLGGMLFSSLPTRVEKDFSAIFTPSELPETPSSVTRVAQQWATDRGWELGDCERLASQPFSLSATSSASHTPVYDDPDYAICLRYVLARATDRNADNTLSGQYVPGEWLPEHRLGEQARHDFEAILAKRPDFFYAAYLLGCWYRQHDDVETATRYFELAYSTAPVVLVMSFDLFELHESWEQNRPPRVTLVNNRTFAHDIDLTYQYGVDDCAKVRYPLLRADENGLVLIPAESDWLTWERTCYPDLPAVAQPNRKFDTAWRFRSQSKVSYLQHVEMISRPYDTNPIRTDPFFDPIWGTQQSFGVYERIATWCESQGEWPLLYDRQLLTPLSHDAPTCWQRGRVVPYKDTQPFGFVLTESGTIRPTGGTEIVLIDTCDPRLLTWYLQQTGMTRNVLFAKMRDHQTEHIPNEEIALPLGMGAVLVVVVDDRAAWLVKLAPTQASCMVTTLRIGSL